MESLHAPWRMAYLRRPPSNTTTSGTFVRIAQSTDDEANLVVVRKQHCYAVLNAYPYAGGHLLIVPYRQVADMNGLTDAELLEMMQLTRDCQNALTQTLKADGFNIGINIGAASGAGIADHIHIHIVPRWKGDINFMPVTAETAIISQGLSDVTKALREYFRTVPPGNPA